MEENEGGGSGFGGDPTDHHLHRNEAISAVAEEGFLGEEDDDYEDLYNDVNVGENFFQSIKKNEDFGVRKEEGVSEKRGMQMALNPTSQPLLPHPPSQGVLDGGGGGGGGERKFERDEAGSSAVRVSSGRVMEEYQQQQQQQQNTGFRGPGVGGGGGPGGTPGGGGDGGELRVELVQPLGNKGAGELVELTVSNSVLNQGGMIHQQPPPPHAPSGGSLIGTLGNMGNVGNVGNMGGIEGTVRPGSANVNGAGGNRYGNVGGTVGGGTGAGGGGGGQGTILFVGDLHWWTTDAELEVELSKYGPVKEVKFFDEKASGKSKGYCQVEFYDPAAATACKDGMNVHLFNGRPCVVAFASPYTVKRMGEGQVNRNQQVTQSAITQGRRATGDLPAKPGGNNIATGGNYQGGGENNRGYGRGNWGRGNAQGLGNRGPMGPMRSRGGGMGGRGMMGNGGNGFGQGIGATPPLMHPQAMMGQGFDPAFGGPMGRMGSYGGFPVAPTPPFSGILSSFPPVGNVGLPGVAPHVNPAFFGRGMPMNTMGMMPTTGVDGPNVGMWSDPNMGGWASEEHGGRAGESSYGDEAVSDHHYGEVSHDRGVWPNAMKEKDRGSERDWSGSSERRYRDDREPGYGRDIPREKDAGDDSDWSDRRPREERDVVGRDRDRERDRDQERSRDRDRDRDRERDQDRHRDDREKYADHHRYREREPEYDDEWNRGRSSRTHSKSRIPHEEQRRSRSRDAEYGKRRRLTSE